MESVKPEWGNRLNHAARGILGLVLAALAFPSNANQPADCKFSGLDLPADFAVLAGGEYSGRPLAVQIDQSGHQATQMDVTVNYTAKPVVLILGAYEPTIWNLGWTQGTRILAVVATGYHRQAIAGIEATVPRIISSYDNRGPCGYLYVQENNEALNPLARRVFGKPVDLVYPAPGGSVVIGERVLNPGELVTSAAAPPRASLPHNAYVVLKEFEFPAGLFGAHSATFFVPKGVPVPTGQPGHSEVRDFNTAGCLGPACRAR